MSAVEAPIRDVLRSRPVLLDGESSLSVRALIGGLMSDARSAAFAVARIRLAGIDLAPSEISSLERCRVLIGRLDAGTFADAAAAVDRDAGRLASIRTLLAFVGSGRLEVRAAGRDAWTPDFSVLQGAPGAGGEAARDVLLLGAHYFAERFPIAGPAFTCAIADPAAAALAGRRFEELWASGYDVLPIVREALETLA